MTKIAGSGSGSTTKCHGPETLPPSFSSPSALSLYPSPPSYPFPLASLHLLVITVGPYGTVPSPSYRYMYFITVERNLLLSSCIRIQI
jgi:hypothetical protein